MSDEFRSVYYITDEQLETVGCTREAWEANTVYWVSNILRNNFRDGDGFTLIQVLNILTGQDPFRRPLYVLDIAAIRFGLYELESSRHILRPNKSEEFWYTNFRRGEYV